ncbi:MAG: hypothetical protein AAFN91_19495, partial [Pseudomonadota bacterium]
VESAASAPQPEPDSNPTPAPRPDGDPDPAPASPDHSAEEGVFIGENGRIIMEAESGDASGNWSQDQIDGETVMVWDAARSSYRNVPNNDQISFQFQTDESGEYAIGLRSGRDRSVMNDEDLFDDGALRRDTGNDVYVRITNLDDGTEVQAPVKMFTGLGNSDRDLQWGRNFDVRDEREPARVELEADTNYQLDIIGRSDGYVLDRVTLNNGSIFQNAGAQESPRVAEARNETPVTDQNPSLSNPADNAVATSNDFEGVRVWVAQDIGRVDIDNTASAPALILGAKAIAESNDNITGSADKMTMEGVFIDQFHDLNTLLPDFQRGVEAAAERYDVDLYSPRRDIDIGAGAGRLDNAMTQSLDTAFINNEQVVIIAGGPTDFPIDVVRDWVEKGSSSEQIDKAIWALKGGFVQVTHGDTYRDNNRLDGSRDPDRLTVNMGTDADNRGGLVDAYVDLYNDLFDIVEDGIGSDFNRREFNDLADDFVGDSFFYVLEDQNENPAVRGQTNRIADTIDDELAQSFATDFAKQRGNQIDISDVGILGVLVGDGRDPFSANDMEQFMTLDFV